MELLVTALAFLMGLVSLIGGVIIIVVAFMQRAKRIEWQHRERMAMIERGLLPASAGAAAAGERSGGGLERSTRVGVVIVALGLSMMLLISFAGSTPDVGVGVGGAIAVIGAAFIVNGELLRRSRPAVSSPRPASAPLPPTGFSDPPGPSGA